MRYIFLFIATLLGGAGASQELPGLQNYSGIKVESSFLVNIRSYRHERVFTLGVEGLPTFFLGGSIRDMNPDLRLSYFKHLSKGLVINPGIGFYDNRISVDAVQNNSGGFDYSENYQKIKALYISLGLEYHPKELSKGIYFFVDPRIQFQTRRTVGMGNAQPHTDLRGLDYYGINSSIGFGWEKSIHREDKLGIDVKFQLAPRTIFLNDNDFTGISSCYFGLGIGLRFYNIE